MWMSLVPLCKQPCLNLVHVHFTGEMVNKLIEIDNEMYEPCMVIEWGDKGLYVELLKALYGTVKAAWLFWERLAKIW